MYLIILQIIHNLYSKHERVVEYSAKYHFEFHVFCVRLQKFLNSCSTENLTNYSKLQKTVTDFAQNFNLSYTTEEYNAISSRLIELVDIQNYKNVLNQYKSLRGDSKKVLTVLEIVNDHSKFKNYEVISVLGFGSEGVVFKAFDISMDELVAIKINFEQEFDLERANSKIEFLKKDIDGKIICFECGLLEFDKSNYMYSVMQLGERTLKDIISSLHANLGKVGMNELIEMVEIFSKILSSIQNVHNQNIVHRDLDPKNIVKCKRKFKIIDFDQSRVAEIGKSITINIGKYCYMAPEVSENSYAYNDSLMMMSNSNSNESKLKQNNNIISTSCDIFSLGCILFELITNSPLRLNINVMNNTFNSNDDLYFNNVDDGLYFHSCVSTMEGEKKLHFAIQKEIEKKVDCDERVKKLLIESIITMIQRDSTKRLNAFTYKLIMDNLRKFLKGEIADCEQGISSYLPKFNYLTEKKGNLSALIAHKYELENKNQLLREEIEILYSQELTMDIDSVINDLEDRLTCLNEELEQAYLSKQMILQEQLEINEQNNALTILDLTQQEEIAELKKELEKLNFYMIEY